jgi:hypothetical protein
VQMCEKVYSNFPRFVVAHVGMRGWKENRSEERGWDERRVTRFDPALSLFFYSKLRSLEMFFIAFFCVCVFVCVRGYCISD